MIMRVTHEVNLLDSMSLGDGDLSSARYRVYWTRLPESNLKSFGVVDIEREMGPLGDAIVLDAAQSDGRAHCARVALAANALDDTAKLLGLAITVQGVKP
jgi:hypothetical protein